MTVEIVDGWLNSSGEPTISLAIKIPNSSVPVHRTISWKDIEKSSDLEAEEGDTQLLSDYVRELWAKHLINTAMKLLRMDEENL